MNRHGDPGRIRLFRTWNEADRAICIVSAQW